MGKIGEGFIFEIGEQQLAHGAHDEKQESADDDVGEDNGRAGQMDGFARAHKQAGADGAADGDELQVAVF